MQAHIFVTRGAVGLSLPPQLCFFQHLLQNCRASSQALRNLTVRIYVQLVRLFVFARATLLLLLLLLRRPNSDGKAGRGVCVPRPATLDLHSENGLPGLHDNDLHQVLLHINEVHASSRVFVFARDGWSTRPTRTVLLVFSRLAVNYRGET